MEEIDCIMSETNQLRNIRNTIVDRLQALRNRYYDEKMYLEVPLEAIKDGKAFLEIFPDGYYSLARKAKLEKRGESPEWLRQEWKQYLEKPIQDEIELILAIDYTRNPDGYGHYRIRFDCDSNRTYYPVAAE